MLKYVQPFATILYPILGQHLDCHHGFVVEYELGKDINLGFHVDDSEVETQTCTMSCSVYKVAPHFVFYLCTALLSMYLKLLS